MSIPTITARPLGSGSPVDADAYRAGIADAVDEHTAGATTDVLLVRLGWITEHLHQQSDAFTAYALGYAAQITALHLNTQHHATTNPAPHGAAS